MYVILNKVYQTSIASLDDLNGQLKTEHTKLDHTAMIAAATHHWPHRLFSMSRPALDVLNIVFDCNTVPMATLLLLLTI